MWAVILANALNVGLQAAFVFGVGMGVKYVLQMSLVQRMLLVMVWFWDVFLCSGIATSLVLVNVFQPVFVILYVLARGQQKKTWGGESNQHLQLYMCKRICEWLREKPSAVECANLKCT